MAETKSLYNVLVVLFAAMGSMTFGFSLAVLGSQLDKPGFLAYFNLDLVNPQKIDHTNSILAAFNCLLYVGGWIGSLSMGTLADLFGRRIAIALGAGLVVLGGALQAGSVAQAMFCVARIVTGLGVGILLGAVPLFQAEISPPHSRGLMVGFHGVFLGAGLAIAQWIGLAFYNVQGQGAWRGPLAIQCIFPLVLLCGIFFLPESPRYLYKTNKHEQALKVLCDLHRDRQDENDTFARREFNLMKIQMDHESESSLTVCQMLKAPSMRKRLVIGFVTMAGGQLTGSLVVLNYGFIIYEGLGFSGIMIAVMIGLWGSANPFGNLVGAIISDRFGRVKVLVCGYIATCFCLVMIVILIALYGGTTNKAGNDACIFFIFAVLITYTVGVEAASFVYTSEIFPTPVRSQGMSFSMSGLFTFAIIFQAASAPAFTAIGWKYYLIFACACAVLAVVIGLFWPETKGYTLEQIGSRFGDVVMEDKDIEKKDIEDKDNGFGLAEVEHIDGSAQAKTME